MEVIAGPENLRESADRVRQGRRSVGFVPTMGAFHEGHLSLMRRAREDNDFAVVSIFVNPLQFGPTEDYDAYPRDLGRDLTLAEMQGVDVVFAPEAQDIYPGGTPAVTVDPGPLGRRLEGRARPGHFAGVCTVVAKLLNIVGPCAAYFGEKDAQQLAVVRRMVADLCLPVRVEPCPTVREPDGLAMSSRNVFLSESERRAAACLYRALRAAADAFASGERAVPGLEATMEAVVLAEPLATLEYATVVDEETFEPTETVDAPARAVIAARVGKPRLIDNVLLQPPVGNNGGRRGPEEA